MTYKSSTTGKTEVACYIFMEKEDEQNIRDAVRGWKLLMPYNENDVGGTIYIGIVSNLYLYTHAIFTSSHGIDVKTCILYLF